MQRILSRVDGLKTPALLSPGEIQRKEMFLNTFSAKKRWKMATEPSTDPSYILQLPMAKAGVKALDTIENFLTSEESPEEVRLKLNYAIPAQHLFRF